MQGSVLTLLLVHASQESKGKVGSAVSGCLGNLWEASSGWGRGPIKGHPLAFLAFPVPVCYPALAMYCLATYIFMKLSPLTPGPVATFIFMKSSPLPEGSVPAL